MREKKYANILNDEVEKEEKLSTTRSLKYKDLHEKAKMTEKEEDFEKTAPISIDELEATVKSKPVKEETPKEDDIYLTSSLKPVKKALKPKRIVKIIFIFILLALIGLLSFFFLIKPLYKWFVNSQPINVYYNTMDNVSDYLISNINEDFVDTGIFYGDVNFEINTNDPDFKDLSNKTFGYALGTDTKNKKMEEFFYVKANGKKIGKYYYEKDGKSYNTFTDGSTVFDISKEYDADNDGEYQLIAELLNNIYLYNSEDTKYFIERNRDIFKSFITKDMITSKRDTIEVNGKNIKVTKNTLKIDKNKMEDMDKKYYEELFGDEKLVKAYCNLFDLTEEELRDSYEFTEYEDDYELIINIYTTKGTKFVGIDIEQNGFTDFYLYLNDKDFEAHINLTDDEDKCKDKEDCAIQTQAIYDIKGIFDSKSNITTVEVKENSKEFIKLEVKTFNKNKKEFNYVIISDEDKVTGDVLLLVDDKSFNLDLSEKSGEVYFNINVNFNYSFDKELAIFDDSKVVEYSDEGWEESCDEFQKLLEDNNAVEAYVMWRELYSAIIESFAEEYEQVQETVSL
jgi:hypothetical protein